jgi:hypothetical protein
VYEIELYTYSKQLKYLDQLNKFIDTSGLFKRFLHQYLKKTILNLIIYCDLFLYPVLSLIQTYSLFILFNLELMFYCAQLQY